MCIKSHPVLGAGDITVKTTYKFLVLLSLDICGGDTQRKKSTSIKANYE